MALIVENGWGLRMALSYASIEEANLFHRLHGHWLWASVPETDKAQALIEATDLLDSLYVFSGRPLRDGQALAWPRAQAVDQHGNPLEGVPRHVVEATMRLAYVLALPDMVVADQHLGETDRLMLPLARSRVVQPATVPRIVADSAQVPEHA